MRTFLTEYLNGADRYADQIDAASWAEAERIAQERGRGEIVVGELMATIPADGMTPEKADAIVAALNERNSCTVH